MVAGLVLALEAVAWDWDCDIREALAVLLTALLHSLLHFPLHSTALVLVLELLVELLVELRTTRYWEGLKLIVIIAARPRLVDMAS